MIGIIGGTGLSEPGFLDNIEIRRVDTPYDQRAVLILIGSLHGRTVAFLPRHGRGHKFPPHRINYRANIWALHSIGVKSVIGVNAVGGIHEQMAPGGLAVPDQLIDYTWGRDHSFFSDDLETVVHVDFTHPYSERLRRLLLDSAGAVHLWDTGVYACTQGPRLETAAEIDRLRRDGCHMVGMTGMPEAVLARELGLEYACLVLSVNWAAGLTDELITMEAIGEVLRSGMHIVMEVLDRSVAAYSVPEAPADEASAS